MAMLCHGYGIARFALISNTEKVLSNLIHSMVF